MCYNETHSTKEWNFAICNNMDRLGRYYAKWNKSDREMYVVAYVESKKRNQYNETATDRYKEQNI